MLPSCVQFTWSITTLFILLLLLHDAVCQEEYSNGDDITEIQLGSTTKFNGSRIFHVKPVTKPYYALNCIRLNIKSSQGDFDLQVTESTLPDNERRSQLWYQFLVKAMNLFASEKPTKSGVRKSKCVSPYKDVFISVQNSEPQQEFVMDIRLVISLTKLVCLLSGLFLFFNAGKLARSTTFYYSSGTMIGVLASTLIVVFVLSKFIPAKKPVTYSLLFGGWSLCGWMFNKMWSNIADILVNYQVYICAYVFTSGILSFIFCYWWGGGNKVNPRTHDILQWTMQLVSLVLIYNGTQHSKMSLAIICGIFAWKMMDFLNICSTRPRYKVSPQSFLAFFLPRYFIYQPRRLLTEDEYHQQAQRETKKALEDLKKFCQSPKCSPWKTLSRLNTPKRFSRFVDGEEDHILDEEIDLHEESMTSFQDDDDDVIKNDDIITDDDDSMTSLITEDGSDDVNGGSDVKTVTVKSNGSYFKKTIRNRK